jgi:hypothetical protein
MTRMAPSDLDRMERLVDGFLVSMLAKRRMTGDGAHASALLENRPDIVGWAERISNSPLDPWQRDFLRSAANALLLLCPRQTGKSHVVSLFAAYMARYCGLRVGCLSPTLRQSSVIFRRAREWLRRDGVIKFIRQTAIELELPTGGYVASFPGDRPDLSVRGDTLDVLIVDEASRVKDALIAAATPTTATRSDARIIYLSTPAGQRGEFYHAWKDQEWWEKIRIKVEDCPRIKPAYLAREKIRLQALYRQEFECEFLTAPGGLFDADRLDDIFRDPRELVETNGWVPAMTGEHAVNVW